jgi:hypothetical protein
MFFYKSDELGEAGAENWDEEGAEHIEVVSESDKFSPVMFCRILVNSPH